MKNRRAVDLGSAARAPRILRVIPLVLLSIVSACGGGTNTTTARVAAPREGVLFDPFTHGVLRIVRVRPRFRAGALADSAAVAGLLRREVANSNLIYENTAEVQYRITQSRDSVYDGPQLTSCDLRFVPGQLRSTSLYFDDIFPYEDSTQADLFPVDDYLSLAGLRSPSGIDSIVLYLSPFLGVRRRDGRVIRSTGAYGAADGVLNANARGIIVLAYGEILDPANRDIRNSTLAHELFHDLAIWGHSPIVGRPITDTPYDIFVHVANGFGWHAKADAVPGATGNTERSASFDTKWAPAIQLTWYDQQGFLSVESQCARARSRMGSQFYYDSIPDP